MPESRSLLWKRECFPITLEILHLPMRIMDILTVWRLRFLTPESVCPRDYSEQEIDTNRENRGQSSGNERKGSNPNILFIQLESFFDPDTCKLSEDFAKIRFRISGS